MKNWWRAFSMWFHCAFHVGPDGEIIGPGRAWRIARAIYPPAGVLPKTIDEIQQEFFFKN